ncbi:hypothetical protein K0M31_011650 [Melipona bicolor]|uniref:Uncharacterized protein n=1 Tax=Melipona bicolor TaxID=60889 RepID=A0AA40KV78_9HYME|nr:hypothetical protein K0M31_011650 [Melipona bicolor]
MENSWTGSSACRRNCSSTKEGKRKTSEKRKSKCAEGLEERKGERRVEIDTDEGLAAVARRSRRNAAGMWWRDTDGGGRLRVLVLAAGGGRVRGGSPLGRGGPWREGLGQVEREQLSPLVTF